MLPRCYCTFVALHEMGRYTANTGARVHGMLGDSSERVCDTRVTGQKGGSGAPIHREERSREPDDAARRMSKPSKKSSGLVLEPPALHKLPLIHASNEVQSWLDHYWGKLKISTTERSRLALTQDRREFANWTGRRLNPLALGCYCYLPGPSDRVRSQPTMSHTAGEAQAPTDEKVGTQMTLPGLDYVTRKSSTLLTNQSRHRHLIFIEPDLLPLGREVTVAHELIHLSDRVRGRPRRHTCHGYDAIAVDEAAITGYEPEQLRKLLREETARRERVLRVANPYRYLYVCPKCGKEYPRVRRYTRSVSCGACDRAYNPRYLLELRAEGGGIFADVQPDAPDDDLTSQDLEADIFV